MNPIPSVRITRRTIFYALAVASCILGGAAAQPEPFNPLGRPNPPSKPIASAGQFTVEIEGAKQGRFKGEGPREGNKDKIIGLRYEYEIKMPGDAATGQSSGKRQHQPLVITKEWGAASPQLFQAAATGETLKSVLLSFFKPAPGTDSELFYTVQLTDARITGLRHYTEDSRFFEEVSVAFLKMEVTHPASKTRAEDDLK